MSAQIVAMPTGLRHADRRAGGRMIEQARQAHTIMESAAYLVAAMSDPKHAPVMGAEVRDSLEALRDELGAAGYLDAYRNGERLNV